MTSPVRKLIEESYTLTDEDKAILRAELDEECSETQAGVDAAWREELMHRLAQVERGEVELLDGEESFRRLLSKFTRK